MIFSALSMAITILSLISQRNIVKSRDYVSIEFDVKGAAIMTKTKKCKNRVNKIQNAIASLLGINENLLQTVRPCTIKSGLKIRINIYINNATEIDMNIEQDINDAIKSRQIEGIIKTAWNLASNPTITNIKYIKHDSKERKQNTVFIHAINTISKSNLEVSSQNDAETAIVMSSVHNNQIILEQTWTENEGIEVNGNAQIEMNNKVNIYELPPQIPEIVTKPLGERGLPVNESSVDSQIMETNETVTGTDRGDIADEEGP